MDEIIKYYSTNKETVLILANSKYEDNFPFTKVSELNQNTFIEDLNNAAENGFDTVIILLDEESKANTSLMKRIKTNF